MALFLSPFFFNMDFASFVVKYGETTTRQALTLAVGRIRKIVNDKVALGAATGGVLVLTQDELRRDVASVLWVLNEFPFTMEEKSALLAKAWEIVTPG
jgi:hypothetical protein